MTRARLVMALLLSVLVGIAVAWFVKRAVLPDWQDRARHYADDLWKKIHREPAPPRK